MDWVYLCGFQRGWASSKVDLGKHFSRLVFQRGALGGVILFGIFSRAVFEVQIAQVVVDPPACASRKEFKTGLLRLMGGISFRPEDKGEDGD